MSDSNDSTNISRLREMAVRGREYSELNEYETFGETVELSLSSLEDEVLIPVAAVLEDKFQMDVDTASEEIEDSRDAGGDIDPAQMDAELVRLMAKVAVHGVNTDEGDAEGEDEDGLKQIFGIAEEDNIGLRGGMTLEVAQDVLNISSDEEAAESFRR